QRLSGQRANTVVELLKQQGIRGEQIQYSAENKTDVYQKCAGINKKIQLVECLAPNRRVNITW
ncbi:MAG: outer membrane assembly protein BamE, partial [Acinetobacter sp.]|nr:outer membrane assembly protein BamE [Acinetobacter sp.]